MRALLVEESGNLRTLMKVALDRPDIEFIEVDPGSAPADVGQAEIIVVGARRTLQSAVGIIGEFAAQQPRPTIVALTTDPRTEVNEQLLEAGADRVLQMPFLADDLRSAACGSARDRGFQ